MPLDQQVGSEIFLQGKYINVGLNASGTMGTKSAAPTGFVTDVANGYVRLGVMGDPDGFGTGAAGTRDALLWGTPVESFTIGYNRGATKTVVTNSERTGVTQITGGVTSDQSSGGVARAGWDGATADGVAIKQVISIADDAKYMRIDVTLTNTGSTSISDLRYMRTFDPDHGTTFETINTVIEQGKDGANGALIAAYASAGKMPLFYYTGDDRAVVSSYGFKNTDPFAAVTWDMAQAEGYSKKADESININFNLGTLEAGKATTVTFYLGITNDLAATVNEIKAASAPTPPVVEAPPPPPPNAAPTAVADSATVKAGTSVSGNVLTNDSDANGDALTASLKSGPAHGTVTLGANGAYTYTPTAGYSGADSFTYAASDGKASAEAKVTLTVTPPPNTAPVAVVDTASTVATRTVIGNVLANDGDADGDALTASLKTGPANGTVTLQANGSYAYTAAAGFCGTDCFTYTLSDGKTTSSAEVRVTVAPPPNTLPVANGETVSTQATTPLTGNVLANDSDADGDMLTASLASGPAHGTVTLNADGSFAYVAQAGYAGADSFTYTVSDGRDAASATVAITVEAAPPPPPPPPPPPVVEPAPPPPPVVEPTPEPSTPTPPTDGGGNPGWFDGTSSDNQVFAGTSGRDTFFFDSAQTTGRDRIDGFGHDDSIVTTVRLYDGNNDGIIALSDNALSLDMPTSADMVDIAGVSALRYLGVDAEGHFVYGDAAVRPKGATESRLGDNAMAGDSRDRKAQTFFFDTGSGRDLGHDTLSNFGRKDVFVTTHALDLNIDGRVSLTGGKVDLGTIDGVDLGDVRLTGLKGAAIGGLEFDGIVSHDGTDYFVYSLVGSTASTASVQF
jgi:VCBS repeat-containing protein